MQLIYFYTLSQIPIYLNDTNALFSRLIKIMWFTIIDYRFHENLMKNENILSLKLYSSWKFVFFFFANLRFSDIRVVSCAH